MKILQKLLTRRWRGKSHLAAFMLAAATAATAWSATPLAVWNGDFNQATTRNGVTFYANDNAIAEDGSTVTINQTVAPYFTLPARYRYVAVAFTVSSVTPAAGNVFISLGDATQNAQNMIGAYIVEASDSNWAVGGIASGSKWASSSDTVRGTLVGASTSERTFVVTFDSGAKGSSSADGLHIYEQGQSTVVYGGANANGLRYADYPTDTIAIGGGKTAYGSNTGLTALTGLAIKKVAIFASTSELPLTSSSVESFVLPTSVNIAQTGITVSDLNTVVASESGNVFVNFADNYYLTADATPASNLVFPYDSTIAVSDTTLTVTGDMPVKPGSAITSIDGSGVILYDGDTEWTSFNTACATSSIFDSSWTGTVWIKNVGSLVKDSNNINACNKNLSNMARYGNSNSKVKFTNVKAYTPNVNTLDCPWTLVLEDGSGTGEYAWYNNTGWTGKTVTFKALEGDGTFYDPDNNKCRVALQFNDASNFAGSIYARGKNIALGGAIFDTSFTESNAGTIQIPKGVSLTVATGKIWKAWYRIAVNGSVTMADTTAKLIGTLSGGSTGSVCGKAPWQYGSTDACNGSNSDWNGTVELASYTTTGNVAVNLSYMGNSNSKIVLKGLVDNATTSNQGPYIAPADGSTVSAEIVLDGDVEFGAANSGKTQTLNKISGSGNLTFSYTGSHTYNIKDVSGYTGTIAAKANSTVYVGVPTTPAVGALIAKVDSTNNKVSTLVSLADASGALTGELKTVGSTYGLYATAKATIGSTEYSTVAAALNAATDGDTIALANTVYSETLNVDKNVTINLNGYPLNAASVYVAADKTLTIAGGNPSGGKQFNVTSLSGAGTIAATNGLRLKTAGSATIGAIDVVGDFSIDDGSSGSLTVADNVTATGTATVRDISLNVAGTLTATTIAATGKQIPGGSSGATPQETVITANEIVGEITGNGHVVSSRNLLFTSTSDTEFTGSLESTGLSKSGTGILTIAGTNAFSNLSITGGTLKLADPYALGTILGDFDASVTSSIATTNAIVDEVETDTKLFSEWTSVKGSTISSLKSCGSSAPTLTTDENVFGGAQVVSGDNVRFYDGKWNAGIRTTFIMWKRSNTTGDYAELVGSYSNSITEDSKYYIRKRGPSFSVYSWHVGGGGNSTSSMWSNGLAGAPITDSHQLMSIIGYWGVSDNRQTRYLSNTSLAVAEIVLFSDKFTMAQRETMEAFLMNKWGVGDVEYAPIPKSASVSFANSATLDLGGLAQTVKSISGSGTVRNGTLTVTDAINLSAGEVLTLPITAEFTPDTVAAKIVDTTAGTVTLCGSVQDAIDNYTSGTLTILASETVAVGKEVTISDIVVADGAELTLTQVPPFSATFENGTLTCTRSAATFVYTGATEYSPGSGNFTIGGVATPAVPGTSDTVQFEKATSIYIGSENIQYAAFILNADVTVTGAGTNYLRVNSYTGAGTLKLAGYGYLAPTTACTIACPLDISGENQNRLHIADNSSYYTTVTGKMTGSGTLQLTKWKNDGYSGHHFACDGSEFYGTINEVQPSDANASRNATYFEDTNFSNAKVNLTWAGKDDTALRFMFANNNSVIKFGSLNGKFVSTASGSLRGHATIEIGNLNLNDTIEGNWLNDDSSRSPYLRKVGTGTLTTSVTDTYGYILNGGTLVVTSTGAPVSCTTELSGYEVVSTTDTEAGTTTYTLLDRTASTWVGGASGDWNTASNWSNGVVPTDVTTVTFPAIASDAGYDKYTVTVSNNGWDPWINRDKCRAMVLNAALTLTGAGGYLAVYGDITGDENASLTLNSVGLDNASWSPAVTVNITCPFYIDGSSSASCWFASRDVGFNITTAGAYDAYHPFNIYCPVTFGTLTVGNGEWINIGANRSLTVTKLVVADGATATLSPDDATATATVTAYESVTLQYSVTATPDGLNTRYTSALANVVPGTPTSFDSETDANNAAVTLTAAQEEQGLQAGYYKTSVAYDSATGKWVVTAALDESVVGGNLVGTATVNVSAGTVTLGAAKLRPGLYYRIVSGSDAGAMTTGGAWSHYVEGGTAPKLSAALPESGVKSGVMYYSVEASDTK